MHPRQLTIILTLPLITLMLTSCANSLRKLIYFPRPHDNGSAAEFASHGGQRIPYQISAGTQYFYYLPPRDGGGDQPPERLWFHFGGNASVAFDYLEFALDARERDPAAAFALFDYPGYGDNPGVPSRARILEALDAIASKAKAEKLLTAGTQLRAIGHSLGAAVALEFATRNPTDRLILCAPFTSISDMARLRVTPLFAWLAPDRFDNQARLATILDRPNPPDVFILHGSKDRTIPPRMSRQLHEEFPDFTTLRIIPGANHIDLYTTHRAEALEFID